MTHCFTINKHDVNAQSLNTLLDYISTVLLERQNCTKENCTGSDTWSNSGTTETSVLVGTFYYCCKTTIICGNMRQNLFSAKSYNIALILIPRVFQAVIVVYSRAELASHSTGEKQRIVTNNAHQLSQGTENEDRERSSTSKRSFHVNRSGKH